MRITKALLGLFFLPGNIVLSGLGISVKEDSGILRSFVNSCFWGGISLAIALKWFT